MQENARMKEKKLLRKHIRSLLAELPLSLRRKEAEFVVETILEGNRWKNANVVFLFSPLSNEVDISPLIDIALTQGKKVCLPVVEGEFMKLRVYTGEMKVGCYGILEPTGPLYDSYEDIEFALIPGMAFDRKGNRMGRGKGFYDRLLPEIGAYKIGVCFSVQFLDEVPCDNLDVPVDAVISFQS